MSAFAIFLRLIQKGMQVWVENGELCLRGPKGALLPADREQLAAHKQEILAWLEPGRKYRLSSYAQQRMWFLDQLEPGNAFYNIPIAVRLRGALDLQALEKSLNTIVQRHESLRTTFAAIEGQPVQVISAVLDLALPVVDLRETPAAEREPEAHRLADAEVQRPFDLLRGPLVRALVLRLKDDEHILLLTKHHIVSDGWSIGIFIQEMAVLYQAFSGGMASPLPELKLQYADFALWQREWLQGDVLEKQLSYWKKQLQNAPAALELPTDHARPAVQSYRGARLSLAFPQELSDALQVLSRREDATVFMTLLAAFQVVLARYSGQSDIVVGTPIANRNRAEIEGLIGFFVNTLVLRTDASGNPTFRELLQRVRNVTLDAYDHQDIPFEKLVDELKAGRDLSRTPFFQVMFMLQNEPLGSVSFPALQMEPLDIAPETSQFDLTLTLQETPAGLRGYIEYSTDLFERTTLERLVGHLQTVLEAVVADPEQRLSTLPMLTAAEQRQILVEWNETESAYPQGKCLHELFQARAQATPDAPAVVFGDRQLTYRQLEERSNRLANHLRALGVVPGALVGICVERSLEMVVGLLAVIKAGGAYVPLDPGYPRDRLAYMLADAGISVLLTQENLLELFPNAKARVICLDRGWETQVAGYSATAPLLNVVAESLAYVIYTSGSTGKPKGVCCTHAGAVNLLADFQRRQPILDGDRCSFWTSFGFDVSVYEVFSALTAGGTLVIVPNDIRADALAFIDWLSGNQIRSAYIPPFMLERLRDHAQKTPDRFALRRLLVGVEPIREQLLIDIRRSLPELHIINGYGPTEAAICSSLYSLDALVETDRNTPIGRPVQNTQLYLLDAHLQPVPVGVVGELYIGGTGLAHGYLNRLDMTAEKFVPNPFTPPLSGTSPMGGGGGGRLYRTGDLARYLPDGNLQFIGRKDYQVKLRGFRIELGEIEDALVRLPGVREAVVVLREERLVAYLSLSAEVSADELRGALRTSLPEYMLPSAFIFLEQLPLNPNGKVDRAALPAPDGLQSTVGYVAPRTPVEETLAGIWAGVLGLVQVGIHDNFFELGGHSLLATQVVSRMRQAFGVELPLRVLFQAATVAELARAVQVAKRVDAPPILAAERPERIPLSFAQQRLWFIDQLEPGNNAYNIFNAMQLYGPLDVAALQLAFRQIMQRHDSLRTTFQSLDGEPYQVIAAETAASLSLVDVGDASPDHIEHLVRAEAQRPFDLVTGPLVRGTLLQLGETEHILLLTMHHIISDGWSIGVLFREIILLAQAHTPLAPMPLQYADFAIWQRGWLQGRVLQDQLDYWMTQLKNAPSALELPTDRARPAVQTYRGGQVPFELPADMLPALAALNRREDVTLFMTLLAAFQVLLSRYSGQDDIVVGSPIANRNWVETENMIGFFVNSLVLRTDLSGNPTFREALRCVRDVTLGAYDHQDIPFEKLVDELHVPRDMSRNPLFQVMFTLQNTLLSIPELDDLRVEALDLERDRSQFDLSLSLHESAGALAGFIEYNTDLFDRATIERMAEHFRVLLESILANPDQHLMELPLMTQPERQQVLSDWNDTRSAYPAEMLLHELFEAQVERTPEAVALVFEDQSLTYRALDEHANCLARHLQKIGVTPDMPVALCLERSTEMVIAILGILKAGGAYIPLDPGYPPERLAYMLADSRAPVLLTHSALLPLLPPEHGARLVVLDRDWGTISREQPIRLPVVPGSDRLAYIIYTSGSTGKPKGVMIPHRAIVNHMRWMQDSFPLAADDSVLQKTPFSFDASVWEFYAPLLAGARLVMARPGGHQDAAYLCETIVAQEITVLQLVPSMLRILLEEPDFERCVSLKRVFCGGEALAGDLAKRFFEVLPAELINLYGPTEVTIDATSYICTPEMERTNTPIGRPIANTQAYILDRTLSPVPVGVVGELYLGGDGLGRGYLNRPELTAERFVPCPPHSPLARGGGGRLYRTGDLARWLPDGNIEYLARADHQVKIRGFRIELGEIEQALNQHPGLRESVVVAHQDAHAHRRLVAYLVPRDEPPALENIRSFLKAGLPDYMLPTLMVFLEKLPLTPNGKLDRSALPAPEMSQVVTAVAYIAPGTPAEETLARIWGEALGVPRVGIHDNFFELGGDSLLALRVISRAKQAGLSLTPRQFFQHQTIAELLAADKGVAILAEQGPVIGSVSLTSGQQWFFDFFQDRFLHWWNGLRILELERAIVNPALIEEATGYLLRHHDALRAYFVHGEAGWQQFFAAPEDVEIPFRYIDMSHVPAGERRQAVDAAAGEVQKSFNLSEAPLLRVVLFDLGPDEPFFLLIVAHHLVADTVALQIMLEDLLAVYQQLSLGQHVQLPHKTTSVKQWVERLHEYVQQPAFQHQMEDWLALPWEQATPFPVDYPGSRGKNTEDSVDYVKAALSLEETEFLLKELSRIDKTSMLDLLLMATVQAVTRWVGSRWLAINVVDSGRSMEIPQAHDVDLSRTVGWLAIGGTLLLERQDTDNLGEALQAIREQVQRLPKYGIPFNFTRLSAEYNLKRPIPSFDLQLNYNGQVPPSVEDETAPVRLSSLSGGLRTSSENIKSACLLECNAFIIEGQLLFDWCYSRNIHQRATIEKLAEAVLDELRTLVVYYQPLLKVGA